MSADDKELVNRRGERLAALLRATDPPLPAIAFPAERIARAARRRAVVRWRAAAAIAVLATATLGVPPVRAWIVKTARVLWSMAAGTRHTVAVPAAAGHAANSVTFTPAAGAFNLRVARPQAEGSLTVETVADSSAEAAVTGGSGAELVVLPDGLRIVNDGVASSSFVVRVPATLKRIVVTIGSATPLVLKPSRPGQRWTVDLRAPR
jgi:hypothetical protein